MGTVFMIVLMNFQRATVGNPTHVMGTGSGAQLIPIRLDAKRLVICASDGTGSTSIVCRIKIILSISFTNMVEQYQYQYPTTPVRFGI